MFIRTVTSMSYLLTRPYQAFRSLPLEYRWETTRRHPYFQVFWRSAKAFREDQCGNELEERVGEAAHRVLLAIGASDAVASPEASFEELRGDSLPSGWKDGAIAPVTVRNSMAALILTVPAEGRRLLAEILSTSVEVEPDEIWAVVETLAKHGDPMLNKLIPGMFNINPHASQRAVTKAVVEMTEQLKKDLNVPETRRRDDRLPDYLAVWDLREGWTGSSYDIHEEKKLNEIGIIRGLPISTVFSQYKAAFEHIAGHSYTFENWLKLFLPLKLHSPLASRSLRRRQVNTTDDQADAGGPPPPRKEDAFEEAAAVLSPDAWSVLEDIKTLMGQGHTDEQIVEKLELRDGSLVSYVRERRDNG